MDLDFAIVIEAVIGSVDIDGGPLLLRARVINLHGITRTIGQRVAEEGTWDRGYRGGDIDDFSRGVIVVIK